MKKTAKKILAHRPLSVVNCYEILSSDGKTLYPAEMTGPDSFLCGCPAGMRGAHCYHREQALAEFVWYPSQSLWDEVKLGILAGRKPVQPKQAELLVAA